MNTEQTSGEKRPVGRPRTRPPRPIMELEGVSPIDREKMARWIEAHIPGCEKGILDMRDAQAKGIEPPGAANQVYMWMVEISILRKLAWHCRTARGGPLAGEIKRRRKANQPLPE